MTLSVVHCVDSLNVGGTELNAVRTVIALARRGVDVRVVTLNDGPLLHRLEAAGIPVTRFHVRSLKHWTALNCAKTFAAFCSKVRPDVVHCHDVYTNILFAAAARFARVPCVIVSRRWGIQQYSPAISSLSRLTYQVAHKVLANSNQVCESLHHDEGVPRARIVVVPNFVDDELFQVDRDDMRAKLRAQLSLPVDAPVIGIVARLSAEKDHSTALRALVRIRQTLPSAQMVLVGDGPHRRAIEEEVSELGLSNVVTLVGERVPGWRYFCAVDLAMLVSSREGFPNTIIEAMALARPVLATNVGGIPDAVQDGVSGTLVPAGDVEAVAQAAVGLLSSNDRSKRMGEAGQKIAELSYSQDAVIGLLIDRYRDSVPGRQ